MNVAKIHRKLMITESKYYFANIFATNAWIFIKSYKIVNDNHKKIIKIHAHAHFINCTHVYACTHVWLDLFLVVNYYLMSISLNFMKICA